MVYLDFASPPLKKFLYLAGLGNGTLAVERVKVLAGAEFVLVTRAQDGISNWSAEALVKADTDTSAQQRVR